MKNGEVVSRNEEIKSSFETKEQLGFNFVNSNEASKTINSLDPTIKTSGAVPTNVMKVTNKQICKKAQKIISINA